MHWVILRESKLEMASIQFPFSWLENVKWIFSQLEYLQYVTP